MNAELQSTNQELETINDELHQRTGELNQVNEFLESILTSLGVGVAVLDQQQRVQIWNLRAEDLWGLRADEALDSHFLSLDIGLPSERLAPALRAVLGGASERETAELEAVNRRGRPIVCSATVLPLITPVDGDGHAVRGAIVMMEDDPAGDRRRAERPLAAPALARRGAQPVEPLPALVAQLGAPRAQRGRLAAERLERLTMVRRDLGDRRQRRSQLGQAGPELLRLGWTAAARSARPRPRSASAAGAGGSPRPRWPRARRRARRSAATCRRHGVAAAPPGPAR